MIYTENTKKAIKLMFEKHKDQVDKDNIPYVFHLWHVAESMEDEDTTVAALLHDIIEDTDTTFDDIKNLGFNERIIEALTYLTRTNDEDYIEYIKKLSNNLIATKVKLSDLKHNSDLSRRNAITKKDIKRHERYLRSIEILEEKLNEKK